MAIPLQVLLLGATVWGQSADPPRPAYHAARSHKRQSLEGRLELLARYLDLTGEQRSALKKILLEREQEIFQMRRVPSSGEASQMDRFRAIEDRATERIRAILTEEQREKYNPLSVRNSKVPGKDEEIENWLKPVAQRSTP